MRLAAAALLAAAAATTAPAEVLRIGASMDYPPYLTRIGAAAPQGIDAEVVGEICRRGGFDCIWIEMPFGEVLAAVAAGRVDMGAGAIGYSVERDAIVDFTCPYEWISDNEGWFYARDAGVDPAAVPVAVLGGTLHHEALAEGGYATVVFASHREAIVAAMDGRAAAYLGPPGALDDVAGAGDVLREVGTLPLDGNGAALVVAEGRDDLRQRLNAILSQMGADGTLRRLQTAWLRRDAGDIIETCNPRLTS